VGALFTLSEVLMRKIAWSLVLLGVAVAGARELPAQGRKTGDDWSVYHGIDSSFVVLFPAGGPEGFLKQVTGPVTEYYFFDNAGTTSLVLHEWETAKGVAPPPVPDFDDFCAKCLGRVVADSTVSAGPTAGRWVYIEGAADERGGKKISIHRLLTAGQHRFLIAATSAPGQPISKYAEWYLETLAPCQPWVPCPPGGSPPKGGSLALTPPLASLLPTVRGREVDRPPEPSRVGVADAAGRSHAKLLPGAPPPLYPEELKYDNFKGTVVASFIVDTTGRVDPSSFKVVEASHKPFGEAVRVAVLKMRFVPAELAGKKVREQIEQRFSFDRWNPDRP
jgi:TonB family protein